MSESGTDDAVIESAAVPRKNTHLTDTGRDSAGISTELDKLADSSTKIAADWSELAGLSTAKKSQVNVVGFCVTVVLKIYYCGCF